jgi:hypothetical protein
MKLFGTAAIVFALAASHCAAQSAEQTPIQFGRAKPQNGQSLRERKLPHHDKKKHHEGVTETKATPLPLDDEEFERSHTRQGSTSCSICGDGKEVGNPDAQVTFPGQNGQIPCKVLDQMGNVGLIPPAQCEVLPSLVGTVCGCGSSELPTTTDATPPGGSTPAATEPGSSKSDKQSLSFFIPSKAGKPIQGESSASMSISIGKGKKTAITTKSSKMKSLPTKGSKMIASKSSKMKSLPTKGPKMIASKASSKGGKSSGKSSTLDAKAEKVSASSKAAKAVVPKAKKSSTENSLSI